MADIFISRKFTMGKSTKTYEERIQEKDLRIEKPAQEPKRYEAQKKQLEKQKKEEEQKTYKSESKAAGREREGSKFLQGSRNK